MSTNSASDVDPTDGLPLGDVGPWASRKHGFVSHYIKITSRARAKFGGNSAFVDLYCGPGRARVKDTGEIIDGSALVAWKACQEPGYGSPFQRLLIADIREDYVAACTARLGNAPVEGFVGDVADATRRIVNTLDPAAFTLVLVDPFNLSGLNYEIFERLATLKHVDFIVHFSTMDIQRNVDRYFTATESPLDRIAPGWRGQLSPSMKSEDKLRAVFEQWKRAIGDLGFKVDSDPAAIINSKNRWIYWLVCASRHPLAADLWSKISKLGPQGNLF